MPPSDLTSIEFSCYASDASNVFLAGTFNNWSTDATVMTKDDQGNWNTKLDLPEGRHEYKFVVDGEWCCEPGCQPSAECPKCVLNAFVTMNRFVDVA